MTPLVVELPIELTNGNIGRGGAWYRTAKIRKEIEAILITLGLERSPFTVPVTIHITRVLGSGQRFFDADSLLRGNSKELIDALVAVGWFLDDGPKYVHEVTASQDASQRANGPKIVVIVEASKT